MKVEKKLKDRVHPIIKINEDLNTLDNKVLFPQKLKKANNMLKKTGIPSQWIKTSS